ncbi:MFS transporter [Halorientalis sp. IM1011]|uniref:MFS transporter n=1 Tax=Halorientalis sp. IM1011 TaxID=1932360 RepID=UPI00097CCBE0|nr:MFS transporter [Halorientalis sp. IM1011]AQL42689.1 MFS transporter [Halorientalis sp. IM1011]
MRIWSDPTKRRWIVWTALAAAYALVSVHRLSTAVLAEQLATAFDTTGAALGTLHASFFYIYAAMQLPAGFVADRVGSRRAVTAGTVVMSVGALVFSVADSYPVAFLARALIGLGGSLLFIAILRFCANWYRPTEFARMSGLTIAAAGFGGVLATTPLAVLVSATDWRTTLLGLGVAGFVLATLAYLLARDSPADAGLPEIDGVPLAQTPSLSAVAGNAAAVLRERETWLVGIVLFCGTGVNITVFGLWGVPYVVQTYGVSVTEASTYTLAGSAGLLLGPPLVGWLSDRLGRRMGLMVAAQAAFAGAFALLAVTGRPPLPVVALAFFAAGFLAGGYALGYTVIKERHASGASGVATGTVNTLAFTGAALLPTLMGVVLDAYRTGETINGAQVYSTLGYRIAFGLAAAAGVLALLAALALARAQGNQ